MNLYRCCILKLVSSGLHVPVSRSQTKEVSDSNRTELNQEYQPVTHTLALRFSLDKIVQKILACAKRKEGKGRERGRKAQKGKGRFPSPLPHLFFPSSNSPTPFYVDACCEAKKTQAIRSY